MHILVTGGAGFIGSHLTQGLLQAGHRVTVLDDFSAGDERNLAHLRGPLNVVRGCITDETLVSSLMKDIDAISHQAALGSVPQSMATPLPYAKVNTYGFVNVLECARQAGIQRIAYASSSAVYGDSPEHRKVETRRGAALSPYAASKQTNEDYATAFAAAYGLTLVGFRYFNVFGPQQDPNGPYAAVIPLFVRMLAQGKAPTIFGDGQQSRDFVHVSSVVQANLAALFDELPQGNHIVNVANGKSTTVNELFAMIAAAMDSELEATHGPERAGDIRHSLADISNVESLFGRSFTSDLASGLQQTVRWYLENPERLG